MEEEITIRFFDPESEDIAVPFSLIIEKLDAFQKSFYIVAHASSGRHTGSRGNYSKYIRSSCELMFKSSSKGSLAIHATLPDVLSLFPEEEHNGYYYFEKFLLFLSGIVSRDTPKLTELIPDPITRSRAFRSIKKLIPQDKFGLEIFSTKNERISIKQSLLATMDSLLETADLEEAYVETLYGEAIEIRVNAGTKHIVLFDKNKEITCYYSSDMEDTIKTIFPGTLVQLKGRVQVNERNEIKQVDEIYDISPLSIGEFLIDQFNALDKKIILKKHVPCIADYRSGLWTFECPRYKLHSYDIDREKALSLFHEDFIILCDGLLDESNDNLTLDAIELKELLLQDIKENGKL